MPATETRQLQPHHAPDTLSVFHDVEAAPLTWLGCEVMPYKSVRYVLCAWYTSVRKRRCHVRPRCARDMCLAPPAYIRTHLPQNHRLCLQHERVSVVKAPWRRAQWVCVALWTWRRLHRVTCRVRHTLDIITDHRGYARFRQNPAPFARAQHTCLLVWQVWRSHVLCGGRKLPSSGTCPIGLSAVRPS